MYDQYTLKVTSYSRRFTKVRLEPSRVKQIEKFAKELAKIKADEPQHMIDNNKEYDRFRTGLLGEAAVEDLLGIKVIDWEVGHSVNFNSPDIKGYDIGVKSIRFGHFPVIFKKNTYSQIFCIVKATEEKDVVNVWVCGLATPEILNKYQDDSLIIDPYLLARGTKTAFVGFKDLVPIKTVEDLEPYKKVVTSL